MLKWHLAYDKNGNIPIESVVEWFLNLDKFGLAKVAASSFPSASLVSCQQKNIKDDPVHLQNYMSLLWVYGTVGEISNLEVLKTLTIDQLKELKEKSFTRSYELYNDIEGIDGYMCDAA